MKDNQRTKGARERGVVIIQKWKELQKQSRINEKEKMPPVMEFSNGREC